MLRELQTILGKNTDAMCKAEVNMVTGMGVVKDYTNKTVGFPAEATDDFYFVTKERIPVGIDAGRGDLSDYYDAFNNIKENEPVKLITPIVGERYAVDQIVVEGLVVGNYLTVGTDGKFVKSETATRLVYGGTFNDAGHVLHIIEIKA